MVSHHLSRVGICFRPWERDLLVERLHRGDRLGAQRLIVCALHGSLVTLAPRRNGFQEIDVEAERARLADLGRRIAETRKRVLGC